MDAEWVDARIDGSDLRLGDGARLVWGYTEACHGIVTGFDTDGVCMEPGISRKPVMYRRDRTGDTYRWQYHAPTRAKLDAADRERATGTSLTSDTITVQPSPPPDDEPGWDHVPVEIVQRGRQLRTNPGDRFYAAGTWHTERLHNYVTVAGTQLRRASHPERLRWLEEQRQAKARAEMMPWRETTYANAPNELTFPDGCKPLMRFVPGEIVAPLDPFAAVRANAKRMMDEGADPRLVLGALDACILRRDAAAWNAYLAIHASRALSEVVIDSRIRALEPCYHGNRAGTCGWCALSRDRSDARAVEPTEPAWETADCEGE